MSQLTLVADGISAWASVINSLYNDHQESCKRSPSAKRADITAGGKMGESFNHQESEWPCRGNSGAVCENGKGGILIRSDVVTLMSCPGGQQGQVCVSVRGGHRSGWKTNAIYSKALKQMYILNISIWAFSQNPILTYILEFFIYSLFSALLSYIFTECAKLSPNSNIFLLLLFPIALIWAGCFKLFFSQFQLVHCIFSF